MLKHYCVYIQDAAHCKGIFRDLSQCDIHYEAHINRTRFWLDPSLPHHVEFYLKWSHVIHTVDPRENLSSGLVDV